MLIPVGYADYILRWSVSGDTELMQSHIGLDVGGAGGDYDEVLDEASVAFSTRMNAFFSDEVILVETELVVGQDGGDPLTFQKVMGTTGTDSAFPLPPNVAVLIKKNTASGGRRNRGRMYLPGIGLTGDVTPAGVLGGTLAADISTAMELWRADLLAAANTGPLTPVILHSEVPSLPTVVTQLSCEPKVATQRRRLRP